MEFPKIDVTLRSRTGKGPARRLRQSGRTPAVLYGSGVDSVPISLSPKELVKALAGPLHTNTVVDIHIDGAKDPSKSGCKAMVRDHQYDPVSRKLLHVDFLAVDLEKKVQVDVPIKVSGRSIGEQTGGKLVSLCRTIKVECLPSNIPVSIPIDVTELKLNESLSVKDVALPEGVTAALPPDTTLVSVQVVKVEAEVVEESAEAKEGEAEGQTAEKQAEGDKGDASGKKDSKDK